MAQGMYTKYLKMHKVEGIRVLSAGTSAFAGEKPDDKAASLMATLKIDISNMRSKRPDYEILNNTDLFICLSSDTADTMSEICDKRKIVTVESKDPAGKNEKAYADCAKRIFDSFPMITDIISGMPEITQMCESDIKGVAQIEKECFSKPWSEESLREELGNPLARFYVLRDVDTILGYIGGHNISGEVFIANIAVSGEYRGMGYGEKLLSYFCYMAEKEDASFITLEVRRSNTAAISLYEKCGFEVKGIRKNFYDDPKEDAVIYTL